MLEFFIIRKRIGEINNISNGIYEEYYFELWEVKSKLQLVFPKNKQTAYKFG